MRTQCELLYPVGSRLKVCALGVAELPVEGGTLHNMPIPEGYARVEVDNVKELFEDVELYFPTSEGGKELQDALHTWTCWPKQHIRLTQSLQPTSSAQSSRARSPTPAPKDTTIPDAPSSPGPIKSSPAPSKSSPLDKSLPDAPSSPGPSKSSLDKSLHDAPSSPGPSKRSLDKPLPEAPSSPGPSKSSPPPVSKPQKKNPKKAASGPPPPALPPKKTRKKKEKPPPEKLPYERTDEETTAIYEDTVRKWFDDLKERRKPPQKEPVDPVGQKHFIKQCQPVQKERESDYDRSIRKSYSDPKNRVSSGKSVTQLGTQSKQTIEPLVVLSKEEIILAEFAAETNLTKAQLQGDHIPYSDDARPLKKPFVMGEPLIWEELVPYLPTRMYELH